MAIKICTGLLMYRFGKEGLEIFLVPPENSLEENEADSSWDIPKGLIHNDENSFKMAKKEFEQINQNEEDFILLDEVQFNKDEVVKAWAFDGDENDFELPLQHILGKRESRFRLRRKHRKIMENGAYFVIKEAVKKVFPEQVSMIKELQDILSSRNMLKYL